MENTRPIVQLRTNRGLLKYILLNLITCGIYGLVLMTHVSEEINTIASNHDGQHTMNFLLASLLLGPITLGIYPLVWIHKLCNRMGKELAFRQISYKFGAGTFWGWNLLGALILVGPLVFTYKFLHAMNLLAADYNTKG